MYYRYNLDPFGSYKDSELWAALEKCHVKDTVRFYSFISNVSQNKLSQL